MKGQGPRELSSPPHPGPLPHIQDAVKSWCSQWGRGRHAIHQFFWHTFRDCELANWEGVVHVCSLTSRFGFTDAQYSLIVLNSPLLDTALLAARTGARVLMQTFNTGLLGRSKSGADLVSEADLSAERAILDVFRDRHPEHLVLAEESFASMSVTVWDEADHLWIVDPLDGTTNYLHNIPHFAVSVACYERGVPVCGVVLNPARGDLYFAAQGGGAWHCGGEFVDRHSSSADARRLAVAMSTSLSEVLVGVGFYYDRGRMMEATLDAIRDIFRQQVHGIRRFGTAALDLCHVAEGWYGGFFEYQLSPWDFAAGRLIVEEAGGKVTNCAGTPLPIEKSSVLASNGPLHELLLDVVKVHLPT